MCTAIGGCMNLGNVGNKLWNETASFKMING